MAKYQGHRSWNAWNVSLWINNDESLYRTAVEYAKTRGIVFGSRDLFLEVLKGQKTPDGAPYTITTVREAMRGIL